MRIQLTDIIGDNRASPRPKALAHRNLRRLGAKQEESAKWKAAEVRVFMVAKKPGNAGGAKEHREVDW